MNTIHFRMLAVVLLTALLLSAGLSAARAWSHPQQSQIDFAAVDRYVEEQMQAVLRLALAWSGAPREALTQDHIDKTSKPLYT